MRKIIMTLATAALLPAGMLSNRAGAVSVAAANRDVIQKATVVCGYGGCVRVRRPGYNGRPYGYYGRPYGYYGRPYGYYGQPDDPYGWYTFPFVR
jgi:hypothetical protein